MSYRDLTLSSDPYKQDTASSSTVTGCSIVVVRDGDMADTVCYSEIDWPPWGGSSTIIGGARKCILSAVHSQTCHPGAVCSALNGRLVRCQIGVSVIWCCQKTCVRYALTIGLHSKTAVDSHWKYFRVLSQTFLLSVQLALAALDRL